MKTPVVVIGGGLAGCEAAYQLARRGVEVELYEMRPQRGTEAHVTAGLAELVCSNSFRDDSLSTAVGVLKAEMRRLGSLLMKVADEVRVPAGSALAVDRSGFSDRVTEEIERSDGIRVVREEVQAIPDDRIVIVASGPLTSPSLSDALSRFVGARHLYFYDAISPIVTAESVDMTIAYRAARYGKGGDDYVNCPLDEQQYERLIDEILAAETMALKSFERCVYFEGCMPIEELARRGRETLRFGPMKPVGLEDPRTGEMPHAVVQLRQDDREGRLLSMVGFQTKMKYPEQRRVFRMIPGLAEAEFVRLGSLHRNTFINSPRILTPALTVIGRPSVFIAGQLVGVEGYVESAATGLLCGINAARLVAGAAAVVPPPTTALGSLIAYITDRSRKNFQPMNANFGLFAPLARKLRGRAKKQALAERALEDLGAWITEAGIENPGSVSRRSSL
ncbi:MAG: methylenetetrahydrofolate--tRNA-(uracil(54)-C(5))-methyltransferase (FADH(2)-oxidizing) TrmFO [Deltaproteobacteria bacterium]|nr:MAG: methylenetetrahydrofolate--tRNA-(uracil(54)-C(5))-methyltransferase (FADH(2)-oxidizing) TrmFO [Deltaproteobacteria bacterium]